MEVAAACCSSPSTTVKLVPLSIRRIAAVHGGRLGHVLQRQVVLQGRRVDAAGGLAAAEQLEQRLLLGAEDQAAVGQPRGEQRLDAERVAGAEHRVRSGVSQMTKANMPRSFGTTASPQRW